MLYITPRTDFGKGYYSVEIRSSDRELKKGDIFCSQGRVLNIIDADHKMAIIRFINGHESCFRNIGEMEWFYWTKEPVVTTDWTYMPSSIGSDYQGKVTTTITRDSEDTRKIISLHYKFLHYHTAVVAYPDTTAELKVLVKNKNYAIIPYKVRIAASTEAVRAQLIRKLPEDTDVDAVKFLISEIF